MWSVLALSLLLWSCVEAQPKASSVGNVLIASIAFDGDYAATAEANAATMLAQMREVVVSARETSGQSPSLVVFPEGVLWWWFSREAALASPLTAWHAHYTNGTDAATGREQVPCEEQPDTLVGRLSCLAAELKVGLVATAATKSMSCLASGADAPCLLFNTAVAVGASGQLLATYRKAHVYGSSPQFDPPPPSLREGGGADVSVFAVPELGMVGLLVCVDLEFLRDPVEKLLRVVPPPGLAALAVPASWSNTPPLSWSVLYGQGLSRWLAARGGEEVAVLYANCGQNSGCWGAGAYRNGQLLGREAGVAPTGGAYDGLLAVQVDPLSAALLRAAAAPDPPGPGAALELPPPGASLSELRTRAENCTLPSYGPARCVRLGFSRRAGAAQVQSTGGLVSCAATFSPNQVEAEAGEATGEEGQAVLVALDTRFGEREAPTPLHLVACSVLWCVAVAANASTEAAEQGGQSSLSCGASLRPLRFSYASLQLQLNLVILET